MTSLFNFQGQYLQESGTNKTLQHSPFDHKLTDGLGDFGLRCSDGGVPLRDRFVLCWVPGLEVLGHAVRSAPRFPSQQVFAHRTDDVFFGDGRRRQFGIKDMELKMVRVRIGWEVTRGGLRPTWSLWQTDALSFVFLVNAGP